MEEEEIVENRSTVGKERALRPRFMGIPLFSHLKIIIIIIIVISSKKIYNKLKQQILI